MTFHHIGNVIIPTDFRIFFRGVGQPPTSISSIQQSCFRKTDSFAAFLLVSKLVASLKSSVNRTFDGLAGSYHHVLPKKSMSSPKICWFSMVQPVQHIYIYIYCPIYFRGFLQTTWQFYAVLWCPSPKIPRVQEVVRTLCQVAPDAGRPPPEAPDRMFHDFSILRVSDLWGETNTWRFP